MLFKDVPSANTYPRRNFAYVRITIQMLQLTDFQGNSVAYVF